MSDPVLAMQRQILALENGLERIRKADSGVSAGATFPTSPPTNYLFYRTDLGFLCYYDGTRWLTVAEYSADLVPFAINPLPFSGAGPSTVLLAPIRSDWRLWHTRQVLYLFINPTNNATNYWSMTTSDSGGTSFWGVNTSADAAGQITKETTLASIGTAGANYLQAQLTKTLAPSAVSAIHLMAYYRLVVT